MNILRLSTLSLTLAIAVFSLGYVNPSAAKPTCPGHPSCKPPPVDPITYTVELMGRVFQFPPGVPVREDGALFPEPAAPLIFLRPGGVAICDSDSTDNTDEAACAWDAVFAACENFLGPNPIPGIGPPAMLVSGFTVPAGNWDIRQPGGVRLVMSIPFDSNGNSPPIGDPYFSVSLQLIGDTFFDNPKAPWLPVVPGSFIDYNIVDFWITGRTVKGVRPKNGCVSGGSAEQTDFDPLKARSLRITLPATE